MQTEKNEDAPEKLVIPLYEIVAYPGSGQNFRSIRRPVRS